MRRDRHRIADMIDAAATSTEYIGSRTLEDFMGDRYFQAQRPPGAVPDSGGTPVQPCLAATTCASSLKDAVIRRLTIIGEAATKLSPEFRKLHPEIPWQD